MITFALHFWLAYNFFKKITIQQVMLQRIQTLFLAIVAVGMVGMVALPIWDKISSDATQSVHLTALRLVHQQGVTASISPVWYLAILGLLVAGVAVFGISQYKNRLLQSGLCAANSILMTVIMGLIMYFIFGKAKDLFEPATSGSFGLGFYALVTAMLANVLANRFIRRDEQFVRSQERMR
jgi:glucan phosphoethanolaminetransferase (alkaline phosphatase superfamily)